MAEIADVCISLSKLDPAVRKTQMEQILGHPSDKAGLAYNAHLMTALRETGVWPPRVAA